MEAIYYDASHPASLGGVKRLQQQQHVSKDISQWLQTQRAYTLHKPARRKFVTRPTRTSHFASQYQADLNDMIAYSRVNQGYRYILTVVDVFSRYAWAQPVKSKMSKDVVSAFKNVFKTAPYCHYLQVDRGREFENALFQTYLRQHGVKMFSVTSTVKASLCERFNRTLKTRMFRYFTHQGSYKWVKVLPELVASYNQSTHRSLPTGMTPHMAAQPQNHMRVWLHQEQREVKSSKKLLSVGDEVRVSKYKGAFKKGYLANWSEEIFHISAVDIRFAPPMYTIRDELGNEIIGKFYGSELQKVSNPHRMYAIEKVLRRQGGRYLVKFIGYPGNHWVNDLQQV